MKCSRIALLLALTVLGWASMAPAANQGATDPFDKTALLPLPYRNILHQADLSESATDWRDSDFATDAGVDNSNDSSSNRYYGNDAYGAVFPGVQQEEKQEEKQEEEQEEEQEENQEE